MINGNVSVWHFLSIVLLEFPLAAWQLCMWRAQHMPFTCVFHSAHTHTHTHTVVVIGFDETAYAAYEDDGVTFVTASILGGTLPKNVYILHRYQTFQNGTVTGTVHEVIHFR